MHGFRERVLLFDTPGWQLGSEAQAAPELLQQCLGEAERMGVPPEMLQERLVLVLVHQAEWIERDVENPSFRELVGGLVRAAAARCTQQPVLVPVLTKKIKAVAVQAFSMNLEAWKKELQGGSQLEVYKAVCSSSGDASTRGAAVRHLQTLLAQASAKSSGKIRETVTELIEEQLRKRLQSWGRLGDSPHALARRWLWLAARHRAVRVRGLGCENFGEKVWEEAENMRRRLKQAALVVGLPEASGDWHTDQLRSTSGVSRGCSTCSSCTAEGGGGPTPRTLATPMRAQTRTWATQTPVLPPRPPGKPGESTGHAEM